MIYEITIFRQAGALALPITMGRRIRGDVTMEHVSLPSSPTERSVPRLRCSGSDEHFLYRPEIVKWQAGKLTMIGWAREDRAWHMQEWCCDCDPDEPKPRR